MEQERFLPCFLNSTCICKKRSEVYGYKPIEEEKEAKFAEYNNKIAKGLNLDNVPDEVIMRQFNHTKNEILQLKAELASETAAN